MKELATKEDDEGKILPFARLGTGGGFNGGSIVSDVWLDNLQEGTVFLAKEKGSSSFLHGCFILSGRFEKSTFLLQDTGQGSHVSMWIDPVRFCNRYSLVQVLQVLDRSTQKEGITNGSDNGSLLPGTLEGNVDASGVDQDDEGH